MTASMIRLSTLAIFAIFTLNSCIAPDGSFAPPPGGASSFGGLGGFPGFSGGSIPGVGRIPNFGGGGIGRGTDWGKFVPLAAALMRTAYKASENQQRDATARANMAKRNNSIMRSVNGNGAKYIAVPVKTEAGQRGPQKMAKVRVSDGKVSEDLYDIPAGATSGAPVGDSVLYLDKP